ncbi:MAG: hypothetical protein ABJA16_00650 [Nakamurella sp.]
MESVGVRGLRPDVGTPLARIRSTGTHLEITDHGVAGAARGCGLPTVSPR